MPTFPAQHAQDRSVLLGRIMFLRIFSVNEGKLSSLTYWALSLPHFRRTRRVMKSPDPLEELRKKELRGELGGGGLFGM